MNAKRFPNTLFPLSPREQVSDIVDDLLDAIEPLKDFYRISLEDVCYTRANIRRQINRLVALIPEGK